MLALKIATSCHFSENVTINLYLPCPYIHICDISLKRRLFAISKLDLLSEADSLVDVVDGEDEVVVDEEADVVRLAVEDDAVGAPVAKSAQPQVGTFDFKVTFHSKMEFTIKWGMVRQNKYVSVCHGFRLKNHNDYVEVTFDHFKSSINLCGS